MDHLIHGPADEAAEQYANITGDMFAANDCPAYFMSACVPQDPVVADDQSIEGDG